MGIWVNHMRWDLAWVDGHTCAAFLGSIWTVFPADHARHCLLGDCIILRAHALEENVWVFLLSLFLSERCDAMIPQGKGGGTDKGGVKDS